MGEGREGGSGLSEDFVDFDLPVEHAAVAAFARAVGEDNPIFFSRAEAVGQGFPDVVAPPTFTVRQIRALPPGEREARLGAGLDPRRVLHAEQEFVYTRLPVAGEVLRGRMRIDKDLTKPGRRGGTLRFVTYESVFVDARGAEVLRAYYTLVETSRDPGA
jgi:acyl dehydratase